MKVITTELHQASIQSMEFKLKYEMEMKLFGTQQFKLVGM